MNQTKPRTQTPAERTIAIPVAAALLLSFVAVAGLAPPATAGPCDAQQAAMPNPDFFGGIEDELSSDVEECIQALDLNPLEGDLVDINPANDVTQHGAPFTVKFDVINIAPLELPVTVVVDSVSVGGENCILTETTIAGAPPEGGTEKPTYRLYPQSWQQLAGALLPSSIVIQSNGHAATASGGEAYNNQVCDINLEIVAIQGPLNSLEQGLATVTALPLPILEMPLGHIEIVGGDASGAVVHTPNVNGDFPIQGFSDNLTVNAFVTTHYHDTSDEFTDTDHGNVVFQGGNDGGNHVNKVEKSVYGTRLIVPNGATQSVCAYGEFWDEDFLTGDDKLATGDPPMCVSITYTQVTHANPGGLTPECDSVLETHLSGTVPSAQDYAACSLSVVGSPVAMPTGNWGFVPVPIQTKTGPGLFLLPPPTEA